MKLQGKTVLVTGGSKGIGRAIAEVMAAQGADVVMSYAHDDEAAQEALQALEQYQIKALAVKADIAKPSEVEAMFTAIQQEFPVIDVLINNAGVFDDTDRPDNIEAFENIFATNLFGTIRVTNGALAMMQQGKIVFISSIHGKLGHGRPTAIAYSSSRAAQDSYMKNLAKTLAPDILVNTVAPGRTRTTAWRAMDRETRTEKAATQLINRWIEPREIADAVLFLVQNDAVCGEVLVIDGGMSLKTLG